MTSEQYDLVRNLMFLADNFYDDELLFSVENGKDFTVYKIKDVDVKTIVRIGENLYLSVKDYLKSIEMGINQIDDVFSSYPSIVVMLEKHNKI